MIFDKKIVVGLIALISTGAFYPAFWTSALIGTASFVIFSITLVLWFTLLALYGTKFQSLSKQYNYLYALLYCYYIFRFTFTFNEEYIVNIAHLTTFYLFTFLTYNSYKNKYIVVKYFIWFHIFMILMTVIGIILYYTGLIHGFRFVSMGENSRAALIDYGFFYVKTRAADFFETDMFIRPAGYYDEPGSFGLVSVLLLILNRKTLNNKVYELFLLFGSLITISMAYIYSFLLFVLLFYVNRKGLKYVLAFLLCVVLYTEYIGINNEGYSGYFYKSTVERSDNIISGTDESRNYKASYEAFMNYPIFGTTMEELDRKYPNATHETIWFFMAQNGIIGTLILFSPFIFLFFRNNKEITDKKLILLIILNLIQRPYYIAPLYLTIIYFSFFINNTYLYTKKYSRLKV